MNKQITAKKSCNFFSASCLVVHTFQVSHDFLHQQKDTAVTPILAPGKIVNLGFCSKFAPLNVCGHFGNLSQYFAIKQALQNNGKIWMWMGYMIIVSFTIHVAIQTWSYIIFIYYRCVASLLLAKITRRMSMCTCLWGGTCLEGSAFAATIRIQRISKNFKESKTRLFPQNPGFSSGPYVFVGFRFFRYTLPAELCSGRPGADDVRERPPRWAWRNSYVRSDDRKIWKRRMGDNLRFL